MTAISRLATNKSSTAMSYWRRLQLLTDLFSFSCVYSIFSVRQSNFQPTIIRVRKLMKYFLLLMFNVMRVKCTGVVINWTKRRDIAVRVMKKMQNFHLNCRNTILLRNNKMFKYKRKACIPIHVHGYQ